MDHQLKKLTPTFLGIIGVVAIGLIVERLDDALFSERAEIDPQSSQKLQNKTSIDTSVTDRIKNKIKSLENNSSQPLNLPACEPDKIAPCIGEIKGNEWVWVGEIANNQPHGEGIVTYHSGNRSIGTANNGLLHGFVRDETQNGNLLYQGEYKNDKKDGYGIEIVGDQTYKGYFQDGERHGEGTFDNGQAIYKGTFNSGELHGQGSMESYVSGDKFEGIYHWGEEVTGTYTYHGGDTYTGDFKNALRNGYGTYKYISGDRYTGNYFSNKAHGKGTETFADGETMSCENWYLGTENGFCRRVTRSGQTEEGFWINGFRDGEFRESLIGGDLQVSNFKLGILDGLETYRFAMGEVHKLDWRGGLLEKTEIIYVGGSREVFEYDDKGDIKSSAFYFKNGDVQKCEYSRTEKECNYTYSEKDD